MTLALCGTPHDLDSLSKLQSNPKFRAALIYTHSRTATQVKSLLSQLKQDVRNLKSRNSSGIQITSNAFSVLFRNSLEFSIGGVDRNEPVKLLHDAIFTGMMNKTN